MAAAFDSASAFPMGHCDACGRLVLTAVAFDNAWRQRRCVHCDNLINSPVEWIEAAELEQRGYVVGTPKPSRKGCGGGCGSACGTRRS